MSMRRSPELKPRLWDGLVVLAVILLAVGSGVAVWSGADSGGQLTAVVTVDGTETERIPLESLEPVELTVESNGYTLRILLSEEAVCVEESDCPTQDCVHTGAIRRSGQSIVCLPARVIVQLEGGTASGDGPDIVIG